MFELSYSSLERNFTMSYFVGAYASSPNVDGWDAQLETEYYQKLKTLPNVRGLEHPFLGTLHPHDDHWFLENIDANWEIIFTCIPGTMDRLAANPHFGLASDNEHGRQEALQFMAQARDAIEKLNTHAKRQVVTAIEIHSAPNTIHSESSANSFKASLETMLEWDWQGAQLVVEHCDQAIDGQTVAKGFLSVEDEIEVLTDINTNHACFQDSSNAQKKLGMVINWGRSVLEARHVDGAVEHIEKAKSCGLLTGIMFSGTSDQDSEYGAWADTHMPVKPLSPEQTMESLSLLTETEIERCLLAASSKKGADSKKVAPAIVGIKLGIRPYNMALEKRVSYNRDALAILSAFYQS